MPQLRDHKAQYRRRIERGLARGLTRSQARGHPRSDETLVHSKSTSNDKALIKAARQLAAGSSLSTAAKQAGISAERLRRYIKRNKLAERQGRSWRPVQRKMSVLTRGRELTLKLGFEAASLNGEHLNAVRSFVETNDAAHLAPFVGRFITDTTGREHPLETRPNALYRLAAAGREGFEHVYRLIV